MRVLTTNLTPVGSVRATMCLKLAILLNFKVFWPLATLAQGQEGSNALLAFKIA